MSLLLWMGLVLLGAILAVVGVAIFVGEPKGGIDSSRMGIGIAIGLAIGVIIGILAGNFATGIAVGTGIGIVIGACMSQKPSVSENTRNNLLVFGAIALTIGVVTMLTILFSII